MQVPDSTALVPDSTADDCNTQSSHPANNKTQVAARLHHFFTYNNYDSTIVPTICTTFKKFGCVKYAFQEERGECGTPHLQGIVSFKRRIRDTALKLPKEIHWEKPRDVDVCYEYCTKPETRCGERWTFGIEIPYEFRLEKPYKWQQDIIELVQTEPDDRKIYWIWDSEGNKGKSMLIKHLAMNNGALFTSIGKYADIINLVFNTNMTDTRIILFDLPRNNGNNISYNAIEAIKNGMICNTKYETSTKFFAPPHVIVFANMPPDYTKLSMDRWVVRELCFLDM